MGFPQIGYQAFKLVAHQRLHELAKGWEQRYPGVDIVLIEPEANDELMFQTSIMSFTSRVEIARHGFETVTKQLAGEIDRYQDIAERHGLMIIVALGESIVAIGVGARALNLDTGIVVAAILALAISAAVEESTSRRVRSYLA